MRIVIKNRLNRLLDTMKAMHKEIATADMRSAAEYVENCCQAATAIEETVRGAVNGDMKGGDDSRAEKIFLLLAQYRKEISALSGCAVSEWRTATRLATALAGLDAVLDRVTDLIAGLSNTFLVVFMPYKAEMWDSMESIWKVCREDPTCECKVMPLPYYEYDRAGSVWKSCYDGERFPSNVPVTDYRLYSLEAVCPDLAYIHNPYDNCNYVTSIDPVYYSSELKKYVKKLVYVPYYVTSGFFSQWELPAYYNMDYMIIQSEFVKESMRETHYYQKLLPLGSPKLDKVIQTCQAGVEMPEEWKTILAGKKTLMLNTSINRFLSDGKNMLEKLRIVFDSFCKQDRLALIWRPHPLLEATIRSIRPDLLKEYQELVDMFLSCHIGIWDDTQDITSTVALSDGYIGEDATSVVNLFQAAGKPVFILNNFITGNFTQAEKQSVLVADVIRHKDQMWLTSAEYNALFQMDPKNGKLQLAGRMDGQPKWKMAYAYMETHGDTLYLSPSTAGRPMAYHIADENVGNGIQESLFDHQRDENLFCQRVIRYKDRIFYLPFLKNPIMEYDCNAKVWKNHKTCIDMLLNSEKNPEWAQRAANRSFGITCNAQALGDYIWITAAYTNQILRFCMTDGTYSLYMGCEEDIGYSGIAVDQDCVWLTEVKDGILVRIDIHTGEKRRFTILGAVRERKRRYEEEPIYISLINMGKWLVAVPGFSNGIIKIDKESGTVSSLAEDFFSGVDGKTNGYCPEFHATCTFAKKMDEEMILIQRRYDGKMAAINVEDNTWTTFELNLSLEDYKRLTEGEDGFEKTEKKYGFFCYESRFFTLEGFMDALADGKLEGVRERQMKELETMAANLDGTCGEKVHGYMMKALKQEA